MIEPDLTQRPRTATVVHRRSPSILALVVGLALLAACGSSQDSTSASSTAASGGPAASPSADAPADDVLATGSVATATVGIPAANQVAQPTEANPDLSPVAVWDAAGQYLFVTTYGSSSCPNAVLRVVQTEDQQLELSTTNSEAALLGTTSTQICTADLAPFTSSVVVPDGVVRTEPLTVIVENNEIVVPPAS